MAVRHVHSSIYSPTGNELSATAFSPWLVYYWGGVALNSNRVDVRIMRDRRTHLFFAPTDDYAVEAGVRPVGVDISGYNQGASDDPKCRLSHPKMEGYYYDDVHYFTWRTCSLPGFITEITAERQGNDIWNLSYRDNTPADTDVGHVVHVGALKQFFWCIDPATLKIDSLSRPQMVTSIALAAEHMSAADGGVQVGYDLRPYQFIMKTAATFGINTDTGNQAACNHDQKRELPDEFLDMYYREPTPA